MAGYKIEEDIIVPRFSEENGFYVTKERSKTMSRIKAKNTKPEMLLRRELWRNGIRYRVHSKKLPGKPDVFINKSKIAIFVDGSFWHGYDWEAKKEKIKSNRDFWIPKIERNMQRDRMINEELEALGLKVFRFWDFEVTKDMEGCIEKIQQAINQYAAFLNFKRLKKQLRFLKDIDNSSMVRKLLRAEWNYGK